MTVFLVRIAAALLVGAISILQWTVTTPGRITDREFHLVLLAATPALIVVLAAGWVAAGHRTFDDRRGGE